MLKTPKVHKEQYPDYRQANDLETRTYQFFERQAHKELTLQSLFKEAMTTVERQALALRAGTQEDWRREVEQQKQEKMDQEKKQTPTEPPAT
jgi:hypothetical protein